MRRLALLCALLLSSCLGHPARSGDAILAEPRPLLAEGPVPGRLGEAEIVGAISLTSGDPQFGGLSGLTVEDGLFTAVTDRGHWVSFRLTTDVSGRPVGVERVEAGPLGGLDGSARDGDAEEVVRVPEGLVVSFERRHRLLLYRHGLGGQPTPLTTPEAMSRLPDNGGVEAIAVLPHREGGVLSPNTQGGLLLIAEEGGAETSPAWLGRPGEWRSLSYHRHGAYRPTAAALLPGGDLLVLERRFSLAGGFGARLVRHAAGSIRPGAVLDGHEIARLEPPWLVDNFEGMAVQPLGDGRVLVHLISDDNFSVFQSTILITLNVSG